jgi:hypothetical protein
LQQIQLMFVNLVCWVSDSAVYIKHRTIEVIVVEYCR